MHRSSASTAVERTDSPVAMNCYGTRHLPDYMEIVDASPDAIFICHRHRLVLVNQAGARLLNVSRADALIGRNLFDFIAPEAHTAVGNQISQTSLTPFFEQHWKRANGSQFIAEVSVTRLRYANALATQLVVRDITARKQLEAIQLGQNRILHLIATGASLEATLSEIIELVERQSDGWECTIVQHTDDVTAAAHCTGSQVRISSRSLRTPDPLSQNPMKEEACWPILGKNRESLGTLVLQRPGHIRAESAAAFRLGGIYAHLAGIAIESRLTEERIRRLAHYDGLTSLPNRFLFQEYLDLALRGAQRRRSRFAVLFLDLDRFKEINDTLGHAAGDHVLREIASRLQACLRHVDRIARMGGDEFYVLIEDLADGCNAAEVAQKLLKVAARPVRMDGHECHLGVSIGISVYPEDGCDAQTLLRNADGAMYRAKKLGKNTYQFHSTTTTIAETPLHWEMQPPHTRRDCVNVPA